MKQVFFIASLCILSLGGYGQNMVPNGDFEGYSLCPWSASQSVLCSGWLQYTGGTPDYFNSCYPSTSSLVSVPTNLRGYQLAASGSGYMGVADYSPPNGTNYREYLTRPITPMQINGVYEVSMSVSLADTCPVATNGLGAFFFDAGPVPLTTSSTILPFIPKVSYSSYGAIANKTGWTRLVGYFTADSNYDNIVLGGFKDDNSLTITTIGPGTPWAFYYIDSVVVKLYNRFFFYYPNTVLCKGDTFHVPYVVNPSNNYNSGNVFTLQLSNANGSFASPVNIGTLTSNVSGTITGFVPTSITSDTGYRIRIIASNPIDSTIDNSKNITISTYPINNLATTNSPVCIGDSIRLFASSTTSGVLYQWAGPNMYSTFTQNPVIPNSNSANAGNYIVSFLLNGCAVKDTLAVIVNPIPSPVVANSNSPVCAGTSLNLTSASTTTGVAYSWTGPNSFTSLMQNPNITNATVAASGDYIVTASLANCSVKDTVTTLVKPLPANINAINNSPLCVGSTLNLSSTTSSTGVTYSWTGPNSFSSTSQNPSITNAQMIASGDYIITFTLNGCTVKDTTTATVHPIPAKPAANHNTPICAGETLLLTASNIAGAAYNWTGPGFSSSVQNPTVANIQAFGAGAYIVSATVNGCTSPTDTTIVKINPAPLVSIYPSPKDTICLGNNVTFVATGSGGGTSPQYQWAKNNVNVASGISYSSTGIANHDVITCKLTNNTTCFTPQTDTSNAITMTVMPWLAPSVSITSNPATPLSPWQLVNFTATATNAGIKPTYQWKRNGQDIVGATSSVWGTQQLSDHDTICCAVTSSYMCAQPLSAISNCIEVQVLTGIDDVRKEKVHIYPNPVTNELIVEGAALNTTVQLFDILGREVFHGTVNTDKQSINTSALVSGTYVLQLTPSTGVREMYKVVKE